MAATHSQIVGVYFMFTLNYTFKCFENMNWEYNELRIQILKSFVSGIFAQSRLIKVSCSTVFGVRCLLLLFSTRDSSGDLSSTSTLWCRVSRNHSVFELQNEAWHGLASQERCHLDGSICLCTIPISKFFHINSTSSHTCKSSKQVIRAVCTDASPHHDRCLLLHLLLMKVCKVLSSLGLNSMSVFPQNKLKRGLIRPQHPFSQCFVSYEYI